MVELGNHKSAKFISDEWVADNSLGSPFSDNLEEIGNDFRIHTVEIRRVLICSI